MSERSTRESADRGYDQPVVALIPSRSIFGAEVQSAAEAAGARFERMDPDAPEQLFGTLPVVDMTATAASADLPAHVIAISDDLSLDCFAVVRPADAAAAMHRVIRNAVERHRLTEALAYERQTVHSLNSIGSALSANTSREELLDTILTAARRALSADSGSIYLVTDDGQLAFVCAQNDTVPFEAKETLLALDETSVAGWVALRGLALNIPDTSAERAGSSWHVNRSFDDAYGYHTRTMLNVPLGNREGEVIGVLSLMNRKPSAGKPITDWSQVMPFGEHHEAIAMSIGSQAAVAIENFKLYQEIRVLFDGFVEASVSAIEARDPSTGGHSARVATLTTRLAQAVDETSDGPFARYHFGPSEITELKYAAVLHDFGKVGVREQVLLKADRLFPWELDQLMSRFRLAGLQMLMKRAEAGQSFDELRPRLDDLERDVSRIQALNHSRNRVGPAERDEIATIAAKWRLDDVGEPVVLREHQQRLCIPVGSLDPEERREIESHVNHTYNFLKLIPWTRDLRRVPELAFAHHEKINGSGYPRGLSGDDIPVGSKLMTISDIFDALTASDRPYKGKIDVGKALEILRDEARRGHIWSDAVELFAARKLWDGVCS